MAGLAVARFGASEKATVRELLRTGESAISRRTGPGFALPRTVLSGFENKQAAAAHLAEGIRGAVPSAIANDQLTKEILPYLKDSQGEFILPHNLNAMHSLLRPVADCSHDRRSAILQFCNYFELPYAPIPLQSKGNKGTYMQELVTDTFNLNTPGAILLLLDNILRSHTNPDSFAAQIDDMCWGLSFYRTDLVKPILEALSRRINWRTRQSDSAQPIGITTEIAFDPFRINDRENPNSPTKYSPNIEPGIADTANRIILLAIKRAETIEDVNG